MTQVVFQFGILIPISAIIIIGTLLLFHSVIKTGTQKTWALRSISILILVGEFVKIVYFVGENNGVLNHSQLPFHLCSLFLVTFAINAFCNGKVSKFLLPFSFFGGFMGGLAPFMVPYAIYDYLVVHTMNTGMIHWVGIHSILYHVCMIIFAISLVMFKMYKPTLKGVAQSMMVVIPSALIMIGVMFFIEGMYVPTNSDTHLGVNYFELGPYGSVLKPIFDIVTYPVGVFLYFMIIAALLVIVWAGFTYVPRIWKRET